jgi:glycosyltransferase involved in cell wall biosynthesis
MGNNKQPLVSVIMPTYNTARFIRSAIESVLNQTYSEWELVIIDDGSTDDTHRIVASFSDVRIKYHPLDRNYGRGHARNAAIAKSQGDYIAIFDADDISLPTRLEKQVSFMEANTNIHILGTQLLHFSDSSKPGKMYHFPEQPHQVKQFFKNGMMGIAHASCMLRKSCFVQLRYEDNIAYNVEDFELFLQLNKYFNMAALSEALVLYRNDLAALSFEKVKHHDLYHHYAMYSAASKLANTPITPYNIWVNSYRETWKHKVRSTIVYSKVKVKSLVKSMLK